jgi:hypothetical protein
VNRRPPTPTWALLLVLSAAAPAAAQTTWNDPTLADAARQADLIVLARAKAVARNGAAYVVEETLKGPSRDGETLAVRGLHSPDLADRRGRPRLPAPARRPQGRGLLDPHAHLRALRP